MLVVTGVLIALVLVVMVGNTARTLQGVGWLSITPIDVELPLWMGTWLGIFPTWETIGAQIAAFAFVVGSYFLAEWVRKRHVRKAVGGSEEAAATEQAAAATAIPAAANGNGHANGEHPGRADRPQQDPAAARARDASPHPAADGGAALSRRPAARCRRPRPARGGSWSAA